MAEDLAIGANADGRLELFALTKHLGRSVVAHKWQLFPARRAVTPAAIRGEVAPSSASDRFHWTDWEYRGRPEESPNLRTILVAPNADGRLQLFGLDEGGIVHTTWQGTRNGGWVAGWRVLRTPPFQQVRVAMNVDGRLQLFGLDRRGAIHSTWQSVPNGGWVDISGQWGGEDLQQMEVSNNADGRLELFALGGDGAMYHRWQSAPNADWESWRPLGGERLRQIRVAKNADGRLELFGLGGDRAVYHRWQTTPNGSWSTWESLAGTELQQIRVASNADGRLEMFAIGGDSVVYHRWQATPNGDWESWRHLGTQQFETDITPVRRADGNLGLIAYQSQPAGRRIFFHAWQVAPNAPWDEWSKFSDGPPSSGQAPPPTIMKFEAQPNYVETGGASMLSWQISDCDAGCAVVLDCRDGLNNHVLHVAGLAAADSTSITPQWDTICTLTASNSAGLVKSAPLLVDLAASIAPAGNLYYFKMTDPDSAVLPCFTIGVYAPDEDIGLRWAEDQNGGYTAERIDGAIFASACG